jgi:nucleotide-binding universal stress UspA family protein
MFRRRFQKMTEKFFDFNGTNFAFSNDKYFGKFFKRRRKIMKILIGYDGSECADAALADLRFAGLPEETDALVLSVVDVFIPPQPDVKDLADPFMNYVPNGVKMARKRAREAFAEARIIADEAGEKLRKMFPNWTIETEAEADTPHWAIIAKAEVWKPDLLVVGSHGRSALGRTFFGSVSQKVLYETVCSVRIARKRKI